MSRTDDDPLERVSATVRLIESESKRAETADHTAVLGIDIHVDASLLEKYCFASPSKEAVDLVTVLAAARFADRAVKRRHNTGWGRVLAVTVPVFDVAGWSKRSTQAKLEDCLSYLTGDTWEFSFTKRRSGKRLAPGHTGHLIEIPKGDYVGVPYSNGLDSYAQARLLSHREPKATLICAYTDYKGGISSWDRLCRARESEFSNIRSIPVPFQVAEPAHPEVSFRTRPFIFYSLAAYGASLAGSERVLIPENGQGSIGGSLVMLGNEAPHRSCYPGFLLRLTAFLSELVGKQIKFEHPALLQTKGQVLRALAAVEDSSRWIRKWSCSHDQRHSAVDGRRVHCGVCGGCVLRRVSLVAAGVEDQTEYLFGNLQTDDFGSAPRTGANVKAMIAMRDVAGNSMRDMQRLADLADGADERRLQEVALDVSDADGSLPGFALQNVRSLLESHKAEWHAFLDKCGPTSWVRDFATI